MKRSVTINGILLASFTVGSHSKSCSFLPSTISTPARTRNIARRQNLSTIGRAQINYHIREGERSRLAYSNVCNGPRKQSMIVCHMNKNNNINGDEDEQEESPKKNLFTRMRERLSDKKKGDENEADDDELLYKPKPTETIRLQVAKAVSGISNLPLFQRRANEEWEVACSKTKVGPGMIVPCTVNGLDIIIFASRDGQRLDAFANACPHLGSPFDLATIERKPALQEDGNEPVGEITKDSPCVDCIICPVHQTAFEIESGAVRGEWCPYPPVIGNMMGLTKPKSDLVKFAVRLKGKNVEVRIATSVMNVGRGDEQADGVKGIK